MVPFSRELVEDLAHLVVLAEGDMNSGHGQPGLDCLRVQVAQSFGVVVEGVLIGREGLTEFSMLGVGAAECGGLLGHLVGKRFAALRGLDLGSVGPDAEGRGSDFRRFGPLQGQPAAYPAAPPTDPKNYYATILVISQTGPLY